MCLDSGESILLGCVHKESEEWLCTVSHTQNGMFRPQTIIRWHGQRSILHLWILCFLACRQQCSQDSALLPWAPWFFLQEICMENKSSISERINILFLYICINILLQSQLASFSKLTTSTWIAWIQWKQIFLLTNKSRRNRSKQVVFQSFLSNPCNPWKFPKQQNYSDIDFSVKTNTDRKETCFRKRRGKTRTRGQKNRVSEILLAERRRKETSACMHGELSPHHGFWSSRHI